ncbi:Crp/Fnr family transcriptional regulator [Alloyangia mangrovi]|uniref:Cyclic nucleotide-binding domain-containing protein n=1 Tax=Alloyangia mangrovi TaxID=1779329 RepID=A0A2A3JQI8_9RHOB
MQTNAILRQAQEVRCGRCAARKFGFCSTLHADSQREILSRSSLTTYARGAEIVQQGEPLDRIGLIASGVIKVGTVTKGGDEHLLQIMRRGQLVYVPDSAGSLFSWVTASEAAVCWMSRSAWDSFLKEQPSHFHAYMVTMRQQLEQMQLSVMNMRGRNTLQRLAFWLLEELADADAGEQRKLHILLSRRDLASLLDMTVETLCRSLRQLNDKGAIRLLTPDRIEVTDLSRLRLIARCNEDGIGRGVTSLPPALPHRSWANRNDTPAKTARPDAG